MDVLKKITAILTAALILTGCVNAAEAEPVAALDTAAAVRTAVSEADPQAAVDAIYASLDEYEAVVLNHERLETRVDIDVTELVEYYGRLSDVSGGLADVIIILPAEDYREDAQLALSRYKEARINEFENYDILGAYSIAQDAVIYEQGSYIIMLMLVDNDAARKIIDEYIPL